MVMSEAAFAKRGWRRYGDGMEGLAGWVENFLHLPFSLWSQKHEFRGVIVQESVAEGVNEYLGQEKFLKWETSASADLLFEAKIDVARGRLGLASLAPIPLLGAFRGLVLEATFCAPDEKVNVTFSTNWEEGWMPRNDTLYGDLARQMSRLLKRNRPRIETIASRVAETFAADW